MQVSIYNVLKNISDILTITIPVYERVDFFETAINSALNQTMRVPILVIDNASSHDKFENFCFQYRDRVRYIKNESNIGMYQNWNKCVQEANSEYVFILGDDDIIAPNYVESFLKIYNETPSIDVFYSDFQYLFDDHNVVISKSDWRYSNIWGYNKGSKIKENAVIKGLCLPTIACTTRRNLLLKTPLIANPHASNDWFFYYHLPDDTLFYGARQELVTYRKHKQADTASSLTTANCIISHQCILYNILPYSNRRNKINGKIEIYSVLIQYYILRYHLIVNFFVFDSPYRGIRIQMFKFSDFLLILLGFSLFLFRRIKKLLFKK